MFSLELPHRGDSNEYTQYTIFNIKKKITLNYPKYAVMSFFSFGLKNEFETAMVNEPSVFEPLKVYNSWIACFLKNSNLCEIYFFPLGDSNKSMNIKLYQMPFYVRKMIKMHLK